MMHERVVIPELMDQPELTEPELISALRGLARLNWISQSIPSIWNRIKHNLTIHDSEQGISVLDVACGDGELLCGLALRAHNEGIKFQGKGIDINPKSITLAKKRSLNAGINLSFSVSDAVHDKVPGSFDIVTCSLFLHHLKPPEVIRVMQALRESARRLVLINDLVRSSLNYWMILVASRVLTRSSIVHTDALRSVYAAFTKDEFMQAAQEAGYKQFAITQAFPCRMILIEHCNPQHE